MGLNYTRTYWKMKVGADALEKVRQKAKELVGSGVTLDEDDDCVRVIGSLEQINELERACDIADREYWNASRKPPDGSVLEFQEPEKK